MDDSTESPRRGHRLSEALQQVMAMQEIAGNPLSDEDIEMFEMFERENWSHERSLAYIRTKATELSQG
jgi:hypothetical protein